MTTYCRFWIRIKDSTIYAGVGSPSLNRLGITVCLEVTKYQCAGDSRVAGGKLFLAYSKGMRFLGIHIQLLLSIEDESAQNSREG